MQEITGVGTPGTQIFCYWHSVLLVDCWCAMLVDVLCHCQDSYVAGFATIQLLPVRTDSWTCHLSLQAQILVVLHCFALSGHCKVCWERWVSILVRSPSSQTRLAGWLCSPGARYVSHCISIISFVGVFERLSFGRPQPELKYPMHKNAIILVRMRFNCAVWWVVWWVICYVILWRVRSHVAARKSQQHRPKAARFDTAENDDDDDAAQDQPSILEWRNHHPAVPGCAMCRDYSLHHPTTLMLLPRISL